MEKNYSLVSFFFFSVSEFSRGNGNFVQKCRHEKSRLEELSLFAKTRVSIVCVSYGRPYTV